jgi:asparagine synthase (glutamine-hydrolysing)
MCGICGTMSFDPRRTVDRAVLEAMNDQIEHRGPDDEGYFVRPNVGMAMRRLSIIDVATGHQPISNEDGSITIVFNGEIYNYRDLRGELQARGHVFKTSSDTETVVHLYEDFGRDCVAHLRGMFAFAIWDDRRQRLFLARDRLGIKPLYIRIDDSLLAFGSEIKALLAHPDVEAELERSCLPEYLAFGYLTGKQTMFRGIEKLPPGHIASVDAEGRLEVAQYWSPARIVPSGRRPRSYYVRGYRDMLEDCVRSHLMSEVPLGVFLSGGLDSSTIAALTRKMVDGPVETFSVGYDAPESELSYARIVADHLGTNHHEVTVGRRDFFDALPAMIWHEDEPLAWPSSVALYFVARLARERVTVVLTGEGSDETLGGYNRYAWSTWNARLDRVYKRTTPAVLRRWVRTTIEGSGLLKDDLRRRLQHCFFGRDLSSWPDWYFEEFYVAVSEADQARLLHPELRPGPGAALRGSLGCWRAAGGDPLGRLLRTDISSYLIELLMKQDQMSMAASVESRVPFLDHQLVEFALGIPTRHTVRGLSGKRILKEAVTDLLPASIIHRRKMGFPTPIRSWLRGPELDRIENMLLSPESMERRLFDKKALAELIAEHRSRLHDHTDRIWRLLNLELWCRVFLDRAPVAAVAPAARVHAGSNR